MFLGGSPSSRRAWIEIQVSDKHSGTEGVDRNLLARLNAQRHPVALLAEGVDRNQLRAELYPRIAVALLAEGVDRNRWAIAYSVLIQKSPSSRRAWIEICPPRSAGQTSRSPSSRRAWIEIAHHICSASVPPVALLAEGVDRNTSRELMVYCHLWSPSSRRAWIEMTA